MAQEQDDVTPEADGERAEANRADIERTRGEMPETIDAIQERLSPSAIKEQIVEQVTEQAREAKDMVLGAPAEKVEDVMNAARSMLTATRRSTLETVRANPVPAIIAAGGIVWLALGARKRTAKRPSSKRALALHRAEREGALARGQRAVGDTVGKARAVAGDVAGTVQTVAGKWAGAAQDRARQAGRGVRGVSVETPLAVGAAALAVGAVVGFAVPLTRRENELMGEARENLVDRAQSLASDALDHVREAADHIVEGDGTPDSDSPQSS